METKNQVSQDSSESLDTLSPEAKEWILEHADIFHSYNPALKENGLPAEHYSSF